MMQQSYDFYRKHNKLKFRNLTYMTLVSLNKTYKHTIAMPLLPYFFSLPLPPKSQQPINTGVMSQLAFQENMKKKYLKKSQT